VKLFKRIYRFLSRSVTVLVIPHTDLPLLRGRFSMSFMLFLVALWTGITVWGGFLAGRHVDYWVTKADNVVIQTKMKYMSDEIDKSREMLEMARATDKQMRILLGMGSRSSILKKEEALGGPNAADRMHLGGSVTAAARLPQTQIRKSVSEIRMETEKRLASFQEIAWYITNQRSLHRATPNIWPTTGRLTSGFGYRFSPFRGRRLHSGSLHEGVDIANSSDTPIVATADGVVRYSGWKGGFGMMVVLDHGFGYSTAYGHTSKAVVKVGDHVERGQLVAFMGTTGRSTGNHLHYEVWRHGKPVNPIKYLRGRPGSGTGAAR
jgi:murein DD-endopeptidase MepM/ murein hydrolase activator NlpD